MVASSECFEKLNICIPDGTFLYAKEGGDAREAIASLSMTVLLACYQLLLLPVVQKLPTTKPNE